MADNAGDDGGAWNLIMTNADTDIDTDGDVGKWTTVEYGGRKKQAKTPSPILPSKRTKGIAQKKTNRDAVHRPVKLSNRRGSGKATTAANLSQPISNFFQLGQTIATNMNAFPSSTAIGSKTTTQGVPPTSSRNTNDKDDPTAHK